MDRNGDVILYVLIIGGRSEYCGGDEADERGA